MRALIFGCGRMGRVRAVALGLARVQIAGVYDIEPNRAEELSAFVGRVPIIRNLSDLWPSADMALVCTTPDSHYKLALQALNARLALFIEKPVTLSHSEARHLVDASERSGIVAVVGHMNRLRPSVLALHEFLAKSPAIGVVAHWIGPAYKVPWWNDTTRSGGPFYEQGIHVVDLLTFLLGPASRVWACERLHFGGTAEVTAVVVSFQSSSLATFVYSYVSPDRSIELAFFSEQGVSKLSGWSFDLSGSAGNINGNNTSLDRNWIFERETEMFVNLVRSGSRDFSTPTIRSSLHTLRIMEAIREAIRTGVSVTIPAEAEL